MTRAISLFVGVSILGVMSTSYAANPLCYKPSPRGNDVKQTPRKQEAYLFYMDKSFTLVVEDGLGYCKALKSTTRTAVVKCTHKYTLYTADQLQAPIRAKVGMADRCLKNGAPANELASYAPPICGTDGSGGGFNVIVKPGADVCEKVTTHEDIMQPGNTELKNQHFLPKDLIEADRYC